MQRALDKAVVAALTTCGVPLGPTASEWPTRPSPFLIDRIMAEVRKGNDRYARLQTAALKKAVTAALIRVRTAPAGGAGAGEGSEDADAPGADGADGLGDAMDEDAAADGLVGVAAADMPTEAGSAATDVSTPVGRGEAAAPTVTASASTPQSSKGALSGKGGRMASQKRKRALLSEKEAAAAGEGPPASKRAATAALSGLGMGMGMGMGMPTGFDLQPYIRPSERYSQLGGLSSVLRDIREVVEYPLLHPELYSHLGVEPPRGVLLHGPPGVGKTALARAMAGEIGCHFRQVTGPEIVGSVSGESESRLRMIFDDAAANSPALIFIDEIDAIAPRRDSSQRGMERRMVAQLFACIDGLSLERTRGKPVIVLAATSRPDGIDPGLRRAGRFDRELSLPIPDEPGREQILRIMAGKMRLAARGDGSAFDFRAVARATPGYVGADLGALCKEAAVCAVNRAFSTLNVDAGADIGTNGGSAASIPATHLQSAGTVATDTDVEIAVAGVAAFQSGSTDPSALAGIGANVSGDNEAWKALGAFTAEQLEPLYVTYEDFMLAVPKVQATATREGFAMIPNVTWADVGALAEVRAELDMAIVQPLRRPELFAALGLKAPAGLLLYGPPGCGKTLLAKAVANETSANFISVKGPELLDKYVGESERAVRQVFARARASAPCVVFFDELDALAPRRGGGGASSGGGVSERVVNQLLTELDGLEARRDVFILAATNRPDIIDPAMLRPGRLDKLLYVPLPNATERLSILMTQARSTPLGPDVVLAAIAGDARCNGFSGADLAGLVREASVAALKEYLAIPVPTEAAGLVALAAEVAAVVVATHHFDYAFTKVLPSVSPADERQYKALQGSLRRSRSHITPAAAPDTPVA